MQRAYVMRWTPPYAERALALVMMLALAMLASACGEDADSPSPAKPDAQDSRKIAALSDDEVTTVCGSVCAQAQPWEITCPSGDGTFTVSSQGMADCSDDCLSLKAAKPDCALTVGDLRRMAVKPADCAEAEAVTALGFQLLGCTL